MFVVYETASTLYLSHYHSKSKGPFKSKSAAKAALTRALKADVTLIASNFAIEDYVTFWKTIEKTVTKQNCLTGVSFTQPANTAYPDPSHEAYHCF